MKTFNRIIAWLDRPATRSWVVAIYVAMIITTAIGLHQLQRFGQLQRRVRHDEHATCLIQQRGLPAGHELAASMVDIHALLTITPTTPAQRKAAQSTPPAVRKVVSDLNRHLTAYAKLEAGQPQTRQC